MTVRNAKKILKAQKSGLNKHKKEYVSVVWLKDRKVFLCKSYYGNTTLVIL